MSATYAPYKVYRNLESFATSRKLVLKTPLNLTEEKFISTIQYEHYLMIEAEDAPGKMRRFPENKQKRPVLTFIFLLDINTSTKFKTANLVKMINQVDNGKRRITDNLEMILVTYDSIITPIRKKIKKVNAVEETEALGYLYIMSIPYEVLTVDVRLHSSVSPHVLMTEEEIALLLEKARTAKTDYPYILQTDPQVIWLDGRAGDLIRIDNPSELSISDLKYRQVK